MKKKYKQTIDFSISLNQGKYNLDDNDDHCYYNKREGRDRKEKTGRERQRDTKCEIEARKMREKDESINIDRQNARNI